ncbi:MAG: Flp pilus assembly protein TadG [Paracrocinitomix sp.]|jgi:Flp pilus assembly protein TadG
MPIIPVPNQPKGKQDGTFGELCIPNSHNSVSRVARSRPRTWVDDYRDRGAHVHPRRNGSGDWGTALQLCRRAGRGASRRHNTSIDTNRRLGEGRVRGEQAGLATTEVVILFPVLLAVVLGIVQAALWAHAGAVAQAAADHGVEVAALLGSDDAAGIAAAEDFVVNAGALSQVVVSASNADDSQLVEMHVTGSYPTVFGSLSVTATATTVRERLPET